MIARTRRRMLQACRDMMEGTPPPTVDRPELYRTRHRRRAVAPLGGLVGGHDPPARGFSWSIRSSPRTVRHCYF